MNASTWSCKSCTELKLPRRDNDIGSSPGVPDVDDEPSRDDGYLGHPLWGHSGHSGHPRSRGQRLYLIRVSAVGRPVATADRHIEPSPPFPGRAAAGWWALNHSAYTR